MLIQQLSNGLAIGIIYGLTALGYTMVYKSLGQLNFAHADNLMIGAMLSYMFIVRLNIPIFATFILVVLTMMVYGVLVERIVFRHFATAAKLTFMLVSISLSTLLRNIALLIWGPQPRALPPILGTGAVHFMNMVIPKKNLCILGVSLILLLVLQLLFTRSRFGLAMRIAAEDYETAGLMGVNVDLTRIATFSITAVLGGIAGLLVAPIFSITVELGAALALKAFIAAVVGGVGNLTGGLLTGVILGLLESVTSGYVSSGYRDAIVYFVGILVLAIKPMGLFQRAITKH